MKKLKTAANVLFLSASLALMQAIPVLAVTEDEVAANGKEETAGSIFIWFLCAIAFLKVSQKIDSFMSSLGINVGHTGGSMLGELMVALFAAGVMIFGGYKQVTSQMIQMDAALQIPMGIIYSAVPVSACFILFYFIYNEMKLAKKLREI